MTLEPRLLEPRLRVLRCIIERFGLVSLVPTLDAAESAAQADAPLDIAVLGQFKAGKSSLLNALIGIDRLPVGVIPVTAVVTRIVAGPGSVRVIHLDGTTESVQPSRIAEFVSEEGNAGNWRSVATVDVEVPGLTSWPGVRLVDTPGLGSTMRDATETTLAWLPRTAVALVAVSSDRPLSQDDLDLLARVQPQAAGVALVLTKVDLLSEDQRCEVIRFVRG